jgi:hypothetical protein
MSDFSNLIEDRLNEINENIKDAEDEKEFLLAVLHVVDYISGVNPPINKDLDVISNYVTRKIGDAEDRIKRNEKARDIWMERE